MAHQPTNLVKAAHDAECVASDRPSTGPGPPQLPLLRFSLQHLFWFIAGMSVLLTAVASLDGVTTLVLLLAVLVVTAHVTGTALGSRLRAHADQTRAWEATHTANPPLPNRSQRAVRLLELQRLSRSPWHGPGATALPWLPRLIVAGAIVGGSMGALLLSVTVAPENSLAGIVVGAVSMGVLGGWFAFLGGSFYGIVRHGLREATTEHRKDRARRSTSH